MATYYVSTTGNDASAGTSSGTAWLTITRALDSAAAGTKITANDTVLIEAGTYTENPVVDIAGTVDNPIRIIGCSAGFAAPAIGTRPVTIAGGITTSLSSGTLAYYQFRNIAQTGAGTHGWALGTLRMMAFLNCSASSNTGGSYNGFVANLDHTYIACEASGNQQDGFAGTGTSAGAIWYLGCTAIGNGRYGLSGIVSCTYCACIAHANTTAGIYNSGSPPSANVWFCTLDGNGTGVRVGSRNASTWGNIITNNTTGIEGYVRGDTSPNGYNWFYGNTTNYTNYTAAIGDSTAVDPLYTNAGADDFTLQVASTARQTAWPSYFDFGALQAQASIRAACLVGGGMAR